MKIIQVSAYYPPHLGGQEYAVQSLSCELLNAGHQVQVLTSAMGESSQPDFRDPIGLQVSRLPGWEFGHAPITPRLVPALYKTVQKDSLVHLHIGQAFTPEVVWAVSSLRKIPYIAELHIDFKPSGPAGVLLPMYKQLILGPVLRSAAAVIVLNKDALDLVRNQYKVRRKSLIMNNGIDEAFFNVVRLPFTANPPEVLQLLFVGRVNKQKNLKPLVNALAKTKRKVHLDLVGDGPELPEVEHLIQKLGLKNVIVHGQLDRQKILEFYANSHALVMPSLYEAQPLVLLEAMAARLPIIGSQVVGVAEHINDIGIAVPPTDGGMVDGLEKYFKLYPNLPQMVERGFAKAEALRWSNLLPKYEALYQEVLAK